MLASPAAALLFACLLSTSALCECNTKLLFKFANKKCCLTFVIRGEENCRGMLTHYCGLLPLCSVSCVRDFLWRKDTTKIILILKTVD